MENTHFVACTMQEVNVRPSILDRSSTPAQLSEPHSFPAQLSTTTDTTDGVCVNNFVNIEKDKNVENIKQNKNEENEALIVVETAIEVKEKQNKNLYEKSDVNDEFYYQDQATCVLQAPREDSFSIDSLRKYIEGYFPKGAAPVLDANMRQILKIIESFALFIEDIYAGEWSTIHIGCAIMRFLRAQNVSAIDICAKIPQTIIQSIINVLYDETAWTLQAPPAFISWLKGLLDGKDVVENSHFVKKTQILLAKTLAAGILPTMGYDLGEYLPNYEKFTNLMVTKPASSYFDVFFTICEYTLFIYSKGVEVFQYGDLMSIFSNDGDLQKWLTRCEDLQRKANFLSDPEALKLAGYVNEVVDISYLVQECKELLEESKTYTNIKKAFTKHESMALSRFIVVLKEIEVELTSTRYTMRTRPMPFGVILHGRSKVLKTYLTKYLYKMFACAANTVQREGKPMLNLQADAAHFYSRNALDPYWSKFKSYMWCINFDDVGGTNPNKCVGVPADVASFLRVQNNTPYITEQAELADKGKVPIQNLLTIGSTNIFHMDVPTYMNDAFANLRRFHMYIDVYIKPEYADATGQVVDNAKIPQDANILSIWDFVIKKVSPQYFSSYDQRVNVNTVFTIVERFSTIEELGHYYMKEVVAHLDEQERALRSSDKIDEIEICKGCMRIDYDCACSVEVQATPVAITAYELVRTTFLYHLTVFWILFHHVVFRMGLTEMLRSTDSYFIRFAIIRNYCVMKIRQKIHAFRYWNIIWFLTVILVSGGISVAVMRRTKRPKRAKKLRVDGTVSGTPKPAGDIDKTENVWKNDNVDITNADLTSQINSWKSRSFPEFQDMVARNVFKCVFYTEEGASRTGTILGLGGDLYVTSNHYFLSFPATSILILRGAPKDGVTPNRVEHFTDASMHPRPKDDIRFIKLPNQSPLRDIRNYFINDVVPRFFSGASVIKTTYTEYVSRPYAKGKLEKNMYVNDPNEPLATGKYNVYFTNPVERFGAGDCGSPLLADIANSGFAILGIHMLSRHNADGTSEAGAVPILRSWILEAEKKLGPITTSGAILLNSESAQERALIPLHSKSPIRWIREGDCTVHGSISGFRNVTTSKVRATPIAADLVKYTASTTLPIEAKYSAPVMGRDWRPLRLALLDSVNTNTQLNPDLLSFCVDKFWDDIVTHLPPDEWKLIEEYDIFTAINGAAGVKFIDKMNRKTSAGFPWKKTKRNFIIDLEPQRELQEPVTFTQEILDRVALMDTALRSGTRAMPVFVAQLKDEAVSAKKVSTGKTRVFSSAPVDFCILVRKYLLSCVRVIQRNIYVFEAAPGVNAHSFQWDELHGYIVQHGKDRIIAGDYSAFDKTMPPIVIKAAMNILERMCIKAKYSEASLTAIRAIAHDLAFPITDFFGDLIQFNGSNPSGHPLTVIVNSLANSLYMRYAFYSAAPDKTISFKDNVSLMTYGDDNICGVSESVAFFNHSTIVAELAKCGIRYTMADKEAPSVPFINISEANFLKRGFVPHAEIGAIVACIEHDSISKMLTSCVVSKAITPEEHAMEVMRSALNEYFFYPPLVFAERRLLFERIWTRHGFNKFAHFDKFMPSWNDCYCRYWGHDTKQEDSGSLPSTMELQAAPICPPVKYEDYDFQQMYGAKGHKPLEIFIPWEKFPLHFDVEGFLIFLFSIQLLILYICSRFIWGNIKTHRVMSALLTLMVTTWISCHGMDAAIIYIVVSYAIKILQKIGVIPQHLSLLHMQQKLAHTVITTMQFLEELQ